MQAHLTPVAASAAQDTTGEVDALTETLAGLSVKPLNVGQPKGLLKGVAAPVGELGRGNSWAGCLAGVHPGSAPAVC